MARICMALSSFLLACHAVAAGLDPVLLDTRVEIHGGGDFTIAERIGDKPIYLKFWASWCGTCREEMPHLQEVYTSFGKDLDVISVNIWVNETAQAIDATVDEFGLTVPIAVDRSGALVQGFGILGTPYHVLIDSSGDVVHAGSEASDELDQKIRLLASGSASGHVPVVSAATTSATPSAGSLPGGDAVLFFTATWCDWYLEESRPPMSKACIDAQHSMNQLHADQPDLAIRGVVTRLWTGDEELDAYVDKYDVAFPIAIDESNETFYTLGVRTVPTLVILKDGREVARTSELHSAEAVAEFLRAVGR